MGYPHHHDRIPDAQQDAARAHALQPLHTLATLMY
jgi:hypothetical protein